MIFMLYIFLHIKDSKLKSVEKFQAQKYWKVVLQRDGKANMHMELSAMQMLAILKSGKSDKTLIKKEPFIELAKYQITKK